MEGKEGMTDLIFAERDPDMAHAAPEAEKP